jgi:hypothetical protein
MITLSRSATWKLDVAGDQQVRPYRDAAERLLRPLFRLRSANACETGSMRGLIVITLVMLAVTAFGRPAWADDERCHDAGADGDRCVRAAVRSGAVRPLAELLAMVETRYSGRVIGTELKHDEARWIYELRLLPASGRMFELHLDAATGAVVGAHGPVRERGNPPTERR